MLNGDGLRVVLWVAGCNHCCKGCQNPVTWDPDGGLVFDQRAKEELFEQIEKDPFKTIWLYTGDIWENILHYPMMKYVDVLVDGEYVAEQRDTKLLWKGSANQRVIDVPKTLAQSDPSMPILHCGNYEEEYVETCKPFHISGCCD